MYCAFPKPRIGIKIGLSSNKPKPKSSPFPKDLARSNRRMTKKIRFTPGMA